MQIYWTKINKVIEETPEIRTYMLECPEGYTWEEGSFVHLALEGFNAGEKPNKGLVRHMSICTLPNEEFIGITTRIREKSSEFKSELRKLEAGDKVALFKTRCNVPLKREDKNIYLLSSGVGQATFRPLALEYLEDSSNVRSVHALNIDSARDYLFTDIFKTSPEKNFTADFADNRAGYYEKVKSLTADKEGYYYVVGSDEFIKQNIELLLSEGITPAQIMLDKNEKNRSQFFTPEFSV